MHVSDDDTPELKKWIVKRLEDISDADSDVLADYVLALVKSEDPDDEVKKNCLENLEDFLKEHTSGFVDEILEAIRLKSYLPGYVPIATAPPKGPSFNPPSGPAFNPPSKPSGASHPRSNAQGYQNGSYGAGQSRKRAFNDRETSEPRDVRDPHYGRGAGGDRSGKQMRRGDGTRGHGQHGRNGRHGAPGTQNINMPGLPPGLGSLQVPNMSNMPPMPTPPPGFPPIDPNNPLSAMLAMQAMGFPFPGLPAPTATGSINLNRPNSRDSPHRRRNKGQRCEAWDNAGFCPLGMNCPREHLTDAQSGAVDEYDPTSASITVSPKANGHSSPRGRGRGRSDRSGGRNVRASFSLAGPNNNRSITSVVVEQIPEENFDEKQVREFFSPFGEIESVDMQPYKRLAVVKFTDYYAARAAYDSPKVIFDNRFVKVYWYKPDTFSKPPDNGSLGANDIVKKDEDEEMIDPVEFEKKQAEAQKAHEEKQKKLKEAEAARAALEEKLKAQTEERKKLLEKLAAKTGDMSIRQENGTTSHNDTNGNADGVGAKPVEERKKSTTDALKAKLAELQAEAESMGLPDEESPAYYSGRGRGSYRGRGGYGGGYGTRGRGYDPYYGSSYRGRGGHFGGPRAGGVKRLDNRPKKVEVKGVEQGTPRDEALRQYLFNQFEFESLEPHPEHKDSMVVTFKERYVAESFIANPDIPNLGRVDLAWVTSPTTNATP
ncbi:hypothetical protein M501DRAFT_921046, partial [Patellaria atrata CBS 101060]